MRRQRTEYTIHGYLVDAETGDREAVIRANRLARAIDKMHRICEQRIPDRGTHLLIYREDDGITAAIGILLPSVKGSERPDISWVTYYGTVIRYTWVGSTGYVAIQGV